MPKTKGKGAVIADISIPFFEIAAGFAARGEMAKPREYISGVRIERHPKGGVVLIGTDGHRMIVLHDVNGRCRKPMTMCAKEGLAVMKTSTGNRWEVRARKFPGANNIPCIQLPYPEWWRIPQLVEESRGGSLTRVNAKYLADFTRVAAALQESDVHPGIRIVPGKAPSDPVLFTFITCPHAFGILMPVHDVGGSGSLPKFWAHMRPALKKAVGAKVKAVTPKVRHRSSTEKSRHKS